MNISDYEWLEQVSAKNLSSSSLVLVTKFTRHVRRLNGRVLTLRDPFLFRNMAEEVIITEDKRLVMIFEKLLVDIKRVAIKAGLDVPEHLLGETRADDADKLSSPGVQTK